MGAASIKENDSKTKTKTKLSRWTLLSYGFGHVLNDLTSAMWFSYLLVFFHYVLQFSSSMSGIPLLIGQFADGIATPIIGILSDKGAGHWLCKFGHRRTWHFIGTIFVGLAFPFIYSQSGLEHDSSGQSLYYYSIFIIIFQIGWAATQISHLSIVTDITPNQNERTSLLTVRYVFTVLSNITTHLFTWYMFSKGEDVQIVSPEDAQKFQKVALFTVGLGLIFSVLFYIGTYNAVRPVKSENQIDSINIKMIVSQFNIYHIMLVYMCTTLFVNQIQVFIPIYLEEYLHIEAQRLPILPLLMFVSSSITSVFTRYVNNKWGRKTAYVIGAVLVLFTCIPIYIGRHNLYKKYILYAVIVLLGSASSFMAVTCFALVTDLIGENIAHSAFVYGIMSFADKISNGLMVIIVQYFKVQYNSTSYYRNALIGICGGSAVTGVLFVLLLPKNFELKKTLKKTDNAPKPEMIVYCVENNDEIAA